MQPWDKQQLDTGWRAQQPGYSEYASQAIEDLWPTPMHMAAQMPFIGNAAGLLADTQDFIDEPSWVTALGLLPFLGGATKILDLPNPQNVPMNRNIMVEYYQNPTIADLHKQVKKAGDKRKRQGLLPGESGEGSLRLIKDDKTGDIYSWDAWDAAHYDAAKALKLPMLEGPGAHWHLGDDYPPKSILSKK